MIAAIIPFNFKRHLFRPQIQVPGQLDLRHTVIRNHYPIFTCLITVPSNPGPYRFFITPLHNLPGRVINYHILIGPVGELQPVPVERNGIPLRAFTWFLCADAHIWDFTLFIFQPVIPLLDDGHSSRCLVVREVINSAIIVVACGALLASCFVCLIYPCVHP